MKDEGKTADAPIEGEFHRVDGIVELNNPSPFWWQTLFYLSIVWAIGYLAYYLFGNGPTLGEELVRDLSRLEAAKRVVRVSPEEETRELRAIFADPARLVRGKAVFAKNCASCHAADGGGGIGPNLADDRWLHGNGTLGAIHAVVRDGVPDRGMPPWGPILGRADVLEATAYVRKLRGTKPARPKASQGENPAAPDSEG